ncbi:hypothetical protein AZ21_3023, partial [Bordetella bronchiseptica B20-10725633]
FDIPVDNIYAGPILLGDIWRRNFSNLVVVSPDIGGVVRARALAKQLEADLAVHHLRLDRHHVDGQRRQRLRIGGRQLHHSSSARSAAPLSGQ